MSKTNFLKELLFPNANFQNVWKALIILLGALILTFEAVFYTNRVEEVKEKNELIVTGNEIKAKITTRLRAHAQLLRAGAAFFAAKDTVTRSEWKAFIEGARIEKNLPGIQGLGFSLIVPKSQLQQRIQRIRNEGFPDFTVKPSGDRPVYSSIIYLEPFSGRNLRAFGYDMFAEPTRRRAMEAARDFDVAMLSGKVTLVQETNENVQTGTLMYVPVYRNGMPANTTEQRRAAIIGWVYSPYRMNDLMEGILGNWDFNKQDRIHLQVYDSIVSASALLYDSQFNESLQDTNIPGQIVNLPIDFNGQMWILSFSKSMEQSALSGKVLIILASGILISLLLFVLSLSLFNTYSQAKHKAVKLTSEIKVSEERFGILLNSTAEGIYGINPEGKCIFSNPACLQLLGYENAGQLLGQDMHQLIHHHLADGSILDESNCLIHASFKQGEKAYSANEVFWRADGSCFPVEYWSNPVFINGKVEASVVTFFDITKRRQAEDEILKAKNEAVKANHAKTEFLSRMSHEFRTPMNSILGFAQLLDMGELNPKQKKNNNHILTSGRYLLKLIDEVLDISSIEAGKLALACEPVILAPLIHELMDSLRPQILEQQLTIEFENSPTSQRFVEADRQRLQQVLLNLLSNAIKYNRAGGLVQIKTQLMPKDETGIVPIRISITNTGEAISAENIRKLFEPFERIGAEKTKTVGSGLGLTVVKKLMEAMQGAIGVESIPGVGNTFWIELPVSENQKSRKEQVEINVKLTTYLADVNKDFPSQNEEKGKRAAELTVANEELAFQNEEKAKRATEIAIANKELGFSNANELTTANADREKTGTILYVEDNLPGIELVEGIISRYWPKMNLITSMVGENAVKLASENKPDLILLDLDLPDIHGSEVLKNLRADAQTRDIPVVIVSADAMPQQLERLLKAGAGDFLIKPLDIVAFLRVIDVWIK
jgi:PAS domain S-box-containing protein